MKAETCFHAVIILFTIIKIFPKALTIGMMAAKMHSHCSVQQCIQISIKANARLQHFKSISIMFGSSLLECD